MTSKILEFHISLLLFLCQGRELDAKKKYVSRETQSNRLNDFEEELAPEYDDDDDDDDYESMTDRYVNIIYHWFSFQLLIG